MKSDGRFSVSFFKIQKHSTDDKSGISCHNLVASLIITWGDLSYYSMRGVVLIRLFTEVSCLGACCL